ncbi:helix-turn-helix domain-containing protein [Acetatifactor muris]|jgi:transcriptional regulator with XRE-family HTH domain|uniref:Helix-turn-helix protein n=1 Tax=Acetatifactor muris TaxID=879566 RepID=A0A2K4ZL06_9FIRM|nr:helix-turn-helix transcriptional regulator [Acetatifactor muris]MCR2050072.1 helix-turn-helix domain-containing protein [Acetatifactor muris]SOY31173.1 helix-turn-helix protein [Acetatifactor muris]
MIDLNQFKITPKEISGSIVKNVRARRKEAHLTQEQLSRKSGVSLGSVKRFERTGEISLASLIRISVVLDCQEDFLQLFAKKQYRSIQEIIDEQS